MRKRVVLGSDPHYFYLRRDNQPIGQIIDADTGSYLGPVWTMDHFNSLSSRYSQKERAEVTKTGKIHTVMPARLGNPIPANSGTSLAGPLVTEDQYIRARERAFNTIAKEKGIEVAMSVTTDMDIEWSRRHSINKSNSYFDSQLASIKQKVAQFRQAHPEFTGVTSADYKTLQPSDLRRDFSVFTKYDPTKYHYVGDTISMVDIETGGKNEVINYAVTKYKIASVKGGLDVHFVSHNEKFFEYAPGSINTSRFWTNLDIHQLTPESLKNLGATHPYNKLDRQELFDMIKDTKVAGYNIWGGGLNPNKGFDLRILFTHDQIQSFIKNKGILDLMMLYEDSSRDPSTGKHMMTSGKKDAILKNLVSKKILDKLQLHTAGGDTLGQGLILGPTLNDPHIIGALTRASISEGITYVGGDEFFTFYDKGIVKSMQEVTGMSSSPVGGGSIANLDQNLIALQEITKQSVDSIGKIANTIASSVSSLAGMNLNALRQTISAETGIVKDYLKAGFVGDTAKQEAIRKTYSKYAGGIDSFIESRRGGAEAQLAAELEDRKRSLKAWATEHGAMLEYNMHVGSMTTANADEEERAMKASYESRMLEEHRLNNPTMYRLRRLAAQVKNPNVDKALGRITGKEGEEEYYNKIQDAESAIKKAFREMSSESDNTVVSLYKFGRALKGINQAVDSVLGGLNQLNAIKMGLPIWTNMSAAQSVAGTTSNMISSFKGVLPNNLLSPFASFMGSSNYALMLEASKRDMMWDIKEYGALKRGQRYKESSSEVGIIGGVLSGLATAVGAVLSATGVGAAAGIPLMGIGIGGGIGTATGVGTLNYLGGKESADVREARSDEEFLENLKQSYAAHGADLISQRVNLIASALNYATAPIKLFGTAVKTAAGIVIGIGSLLKNSLFSTIDSLDKLGNPITGLTGVDYGMYGGLRNVDALAGLQAGSTNSLYENFASSQQYMYKMGNFDQRRLIASSLLGVFDTVYAPGGDTGTQVSTTVDRLVSKIESGDTYTKQSTLTLAGSIDSSLPAILSSLTKIRSLGGAYGNLTYADLIKNPIRDYNRVGVWSHQLQENERNRGALYSTQFQAARTTWQANVQRAGMMVWDKVGLHAFNAVNKVFDKLITVLNNSNIWDAINDFLNTLSNIDFNNISLSSIGDWLGEQTAKIISKFIHYVGPVLDGIQHIWDEIAIRIARGIDDLIDQFSKFKFNKDVLVHGLGSMLAGGRADFSGLITYDASYMTPREKYKKALYAYNTETSKWIPASDEYEDLGIELKKGEKLKPTDYYTVSLKDIAKMEEWLKTHQSANPSLKHNGKNNFINITDYEKNRQVYEAAKKRANQLLNTMNQVPEGTRGIVEQGMEQVQTLTDKYPLSKMLEIFLNGFLGNSSKPAVDVNVKVDMNVEGDAKKTGEKRYTIPELLDITIDNITTTVSNGLAGALTAASVGEL